MVSYAVDTDARISREKSVLEQYASRSVDDGGGSLFDKLVPRARDEARLEEFLLEAVESVVACFSDIAVRSSGGVEFDVPDFDESNATVLTDSLDSALDWSVCADYLVDRGVSSVAQVWQKRAEASMLEAARLLRRRKSGYWNED